MIDRSPPRDSRKRKYQKLDRTSLTQHRDVHGSRTYTTGVQSASQTTTKTQPVGSNIFDGGDDRDISNPLPVKTKVCLSRRTFMLVVA